MLMITKKVMIINFCYNGVDNDFDVDGLSLYDNNGCDWIYSLITMITMMMMLLMIVVISVLMMMELIMILIMMTLKVVMTLMTMDFF
jgi:hypothetical protein